MRFVRMGPPGTTAIADGDAGVASDWERLRREFDRQLSSGWWALVPATDLTGCRRGRRIEDFADVPAGAPEVLFLARNER